MEKSGEPSTSASATSTEALGAPPILDIDEIIVGELAERGDWIVANIESARIWSYRTHKKIYNGKDIWILPVSKENFPAVAIRTHSDFGADDCQRLQMRFLSTLSWVTEYGITVDGFGGGSVPMPMRRSRKISIPAVEELDLSYFPEVLEEKPLLALALMREGRSLNHPGYAFLSFYRILEVVFPNGLERGKWVSRSLDLLEDFQARSVIEKLSRDGITDIGAHLLDSGRRAIAHAKQEPIINPDNPTDLRRLWAELPIMRSLAAQAIESILGIERPETVYRKHLYELSGFRVIFGEEIISYAINSTPIPAETIVDMPHINARLRRHPPFPPLEDMRIVDMCQTSDIIHATFASASGAVQVRFGLDFKAERLHFDMFNDIYVQDSGSAEGAMEIAQIKEFMRDLFGNGQLEIYDSESGTIIARKDAFIPVNMMINHEVARIDIEKWRKISEQRQNE